MTDIDPGKELEQREAEIEATLKRYQDHPPIVASGVACMELNLELILALKDFPEDEDGPQALAWCRELGELSEALASNGEEMLAEVEAKKGTLAPAQAAQVPALIQALRESNEELHRLAAQCAAAVDDPTTDPKTAARSLLEAALRWPAPPGSPRRAE